MKRSGTLLWPSVAAAALAVDQARSESSGDPADGRILARQICSECHAIERTQERSANPAAPRFEVIANIPGMTGTALAATLQTSHKTMPNVLFSPSQRDNIIAFILSLKRAD